MDITNLKMGPKLKKIKNWDESNLPTWKECRLIIENHRYAQKNGINLIVDEEPIPTHLHNFIYENEPIKNCIEFRRELISMLNELDKLIFWKGKIFKREF